jgi:hypothetical protein
MEGEYAHTPQKLTGSPDRGEHGWPRGTEVEGREGMQDAPADLHTGGSVAHDVPHIPFLTVLLEGLPP